MNAVSPKPSSKIGRRHFLAASGGLVLGFHLPSGWKLNSAVALTSDAPEINAWIVVSPDDMVTIRIARSEIGQGSMTALAMLVAEELDCDWAKVRTEFVPPEENVRRSNVWGSMATVGSRAIRTSHEYLRQAGASAREMLIAAAAQGWKVPAGECKATGSIITHLSTGRTVSFGAVSAAAAKMPPPEKVVLKEPKDWKLLGTDVKRFDTPAKVEGKPIYAIDVRLPGMMYAAVAHCPAFGGKLKGYDEAAIAGHRGFHAVVPLDDAIAVVGDSYWRAKKILDALPVQWDLGPNADISSADISAMLREGRSAAEADVGRNDGDAKTALASAAKVIEAEYEVTFQSHSPMETNNATIRIADGRMEVWAPTQNAESTLNVAAKTAGLDPLSVTVHPVYSGGGFGRRGGQHDFVAQAVRIAMAVNRPVQLIWSREEDMRRDFYRPVSSAKFAAGFDAEGNPLAMTTRIAGQSLFSTVNPARLKEGPDLGFMTGFTDMPYAVPNVLVDYAMRNSHVPVGYWRSVNHSQNGFFREGFIDEMAHAAGADPYEFRRKLLANQPVQLAVLDAAAKAANWGAPLPDGVHRGIALVDSYGSYVAAVAEISMDASGWPRVHRVVTSIDPGHVVNTDTTRAQMEGAVVWALSAAFYGEISIENGGVAQSNFHDYPMLKMNEMPEVEVVIVPSYGFWGGVGEPGAPPVAPAVCNAIFAATGKRIRSLPLIKQGALSA